MRLAFGIISSSDMKINNKNPTVWMLDAMSGSRARAVLLQNALIFFFRRILQNAIIAKCDTR